MAEIIGTAHAGFTVKDMDKTLDFWCGLLGGKLAEPVCIAVHKGCKVVGNGMQENVRFKACKVEIGGILVEFFEFLNPAAEAYHGKLWKAGSAHLAFYVDDIYAMKSKLEAAGVEFQSDVNADEKDGVEICKWVYLKECNDIRMELMQKLV